MRLLVDHTFQGSELTDALIALATSEGIVDPLVRSLSAAQEGREPVRETYLHELMVETVADGIRLDRFVVQNFDHMLAAVVQGRVQKSSSSPWTRVGRRGPNNLRLTQAQVDELITLIRAHYRIAITAGPTNGWDIDKATERRWKAMGVIRPDVNIAERVGDALTAGRLHQILEDGMSLAEMRRMARELPMSRATSLTIQAVQERVGFDLSGGVGYRTEQIAGRLVHGQNAVAVNDIVAAYRTDQLRSTPTNRAGFSPEEMELLAANGQIVRGWKGLGRELRNRLAATDHTRDWERVAVSGLRMSANIGAVLAMQEGGVDELYFDVHENACEHCKRLYLERNGSPRIFKVAEIVANILKTGGANYGRLASKIGDPDWGWIANALAHPWCQCRPKAYIRSIAPRQRGGKA